MQRDLLAYFARLVPPADAPQMGYLTHLLEGADDMPAHIKASVLPVSLSIPVARGQLGVKDGQLALEVHSLIELGEGNNSTGGQHYAG